MVDDASTDGGLVVAQSMADSRIRILCRSQPGAGGYAARNLGITESGGQWIAFLDADDEWMPSHLEDITFLQNMFPECGCHSSAFVREYGDGERVLNLFARHHQGPSSRLSLQEYAVATAHDMCPIWTSVVVVRPELLANAGMFPAHRCTRGGDVDTWLRVMARTDLGWTPQIGAVYHRDAENMITKEISPQLDHCVESTVIELVKQRQQGHLDGVSGGDLWRILHYYKKQATKRLIRAGLLNLRNLRGFNWSAEPGYVTMLAFAALLPGWLVRSVITLLRKIKRRLRR